MKGTAERQALFYLNPFEECTLLETNISDPKRIGKMFFYNWRHLPLRRSDRPSTGWSAGGLADQSFPRVCPRKVPLKTSPKKRAGKQKNIEEINNISYMICTIFRNITYHILIYPYNIHIHYTHMANTVTTKVLRWAKNATVRFWPLPKAQGRPSTSNNAFSSCSCDGSVPPLTQRQFHPNEFFIAR